jgi:hypothetical protein
MSYAQWSPFTTYLTGDEVQYIGSDVYAATATVTGTPPLPTTPLWNLITPGPITAVQSVVAGANISVNSVVPTDPIVSVLIGQNLDMNQFSLSNVPTVKLLDTTNDTPQLQFFNAAGLQKASLEYAGVNDKVTLVGNDVVLDAGGPGSNIISLSALTNSVKILATDRIDLIGPLYNSNASAGTSGQVLTSAGAGAAWIWGNNVGSLSAGSNIALTGTAAAPVVNLVEPITYTATDTTTPYGVSGLSQFIFSGGALGRVDTQIAAGNSQIFMGGGDSTNGTHSLRMELPTGDASITHETFPGAPFKKSLGVGSDGMLYLEGNRVAGGGVGQYIALNTNGITLDARTAVGNALPTTFVSSGAGGALNPMMRLENQNASGSVAVEIYKNKPTAGVAGDVLYNQSVFGKDSGNVKQEYTRISHSIRAAAAGAEEGSIEFGAFTNGTNQTYIQINGNDTPAGEVNIFKPLDFITTAGAAVDAGLIKISGAGSTNLNIDTTTSAGTGAIALNTKDGVAGSGGGLLLTGNTLLSGSAGGSSGQHLCLTIGGSVYKIKLELP